MISLNSAFDYKPFDKVATVRHLLSVQAKRTSFYVSRLLSLDLPKSTRRQVRVLLILKQHLYYDIVKIHFLKTTNLYASVIAVILQ